MRVCDCVCTCVCIFRALHWVSIAMLCAPVDEQIPKVSDSVERAITGTDTRVRHYTLTAETSRCIVNLG